MRTIRRSILAAAMAGLVAIAVRIKGSTGVPPQNGGWRELSGPELR